MTPLTISLFSILCITVGFWLYDALVITPREHRKSDQYRLFAARDKLVLLVAEGKIPEDGIIFNTLYPAVNHSVQGLQPLGIRDLVKFISDLDLADREKVLKLQQALEDSDPDVQAAYAATFSAMAHILFVRSRTVRVIVTLSKVAEVSRAVGGSVKQLIAFMLWAIAKLSGPRREAVDQYQRLETESHRWQRDPMRPAFP